MPSTLEERLQQQRARFQLTRNALRSSHSNRTLATDKHQARLFSGATNGNYVDQPSVKHAHGSFLSFDGRSDQNGHAQLLASPSTYNTSPQKHFSSSERGLPVTAVSSAWAALTPSGVVKRKNSIYSGYAMEKSSAASTGVASPPQNHDSHVFLPNHSFAPHAEQTLSTQDLCETPQKNSFEREGVAPDEHLSGSELNVKIHGNGSPDSLRASSLEAVMERNQIHRTRIVELEAELLETKSALYAANNERKRLLRSQSDASVSELNDVHQVHNMNDLELHQSFNDKSFTKSKRTKSWAMRRRLKKLQAKMTHVREEYMQSRDKIYTTLSSNQSDITQFASDVAQEISATASSLQRAKETIQILYAGMSTNECEELRTSLEDTKKRLDAADQQGRQYASTISTLEEQLTAANDRIKTFETEISGYSQQLETKESELANTRAQITDLTQQQAAAEKKHVEQTQAIESKLKALESTAGVQNDREAQLLQELQASKQATKESNALRHSVEQEMKLLQSKHTQLEKQHKDVAKQLTKTEDSAKHWMSKEQAAMKELETLTKEQLALKSKLQNNAGIKRSTLKALQIAQINQHEIATKTSNTLTLTKELEEERKRASELAKQIKALESQKNSKEKVENLDRLSSTLQNTQTSILNCLKTVACTGRQKAVIMQRNQKNDTSSVVRIEETLQSLAQISNETLNDVTERSSKVHAQIFPFLGDSKAVGAAHKTDNVLRDLLDDVEQLINMYKSQKENPSSQLPTESVSSSRSLNSTFSTTALKSATATINATATTALKSATTTIDATATTALKSATKTINATATHNASVQDRPVSSKSVDLNTQTSLLNSSTAVSATDVNQKSSDVTANTHSTVDSAKDAVSTGQDGKSSGSVSILASRKPGPPASPVATASTPQSPGLMSPPPAPAAPPTFVVPSLLQSKNDTGKKGSNHQGKNPSSDIKPPKPPAGPKPLKSRSVSPSNNRSPKQSANVSPVGRKSGNAVPPSVPKASANSSSATKASTTMLNVTASSSPVKSVSSSADSTVTGSADTSSNAHLTANTSSISGNHSGNGQNVGSLSPQTPKTNVTSKITNTPPPATPKATTTSTHQSSSTLTIGKGMTAVQASPAAPVVAKGAPPTVPPPKPSVTPATANTAKASPIMPPPPRGPRPIPRTGQPRGPSVPKPKVHMRAGGANPSGSPPPPPPSLRPRAAAPQPPPRPPFAAR